MGTKNELRQLDTRQQCREKLPIWYGSRSNHYHGLLEVMMNANDEMVTHPAEDRPCTMYIILAALYLISNILCKVFQSILSSLTIILSINLNSDIILNILIYY